MRSIAYVGAFADELARAGVRHAVVCPGSRSTPLALMLAAAPAIRLWTHVDERSAAFFAPGPGEGAPARRWRCSARRARRRPTSCPPWSRRTCRACRWWCSPPTARTSCATRRAADHRPGAALRRHAKWFVDCALPEAPTDALRYVRTLADRAVATAPRHAPPARSTSTSPSASRWCPIPAAAAGRCARSRRLAGRVPAARPTSRVAERLGCGLGRRHRHASPRSLRADAARPDHLRAAGRPAADWWQPLTAAGSAHSATRAGRPALAGPLMARARSGQLVIDSYDAFLRDERFAAAPRAGSRAPLRRDADLQAAAALPAVATRLPHDRRWTAARQLERADQLAGDR